MYCPVLKSYASIIWNLHNNNEKCTIKGISWKIYTTDYKSFIKTNFEKLLRNYGDRFEIINEIVSEIKNYIKNGTMNMITLQQKCGKSAAGKYL